MGRRSFIRLIAYSKEENEFLENLIKQARRDNKKLIIILG
jgi:hypothetical protein